jgi:hypothetical protein
MISKTSAAFHGYYDSRVFPYQVYQPQTGWTTVDIWRHITIQDRRLGYRFYLHAHPYVSELVTRLIRASTPGLEAADTDYVRNPDGTFAYLKNPDGTMQELSDGTPIPRPVLYDELFSTTSYNPSNLVQVPYPVKDLDFTSSGAYSVYNWELFYHVPLTVAIHLSKNQRFQDAQRWFHYVFDPTDDSDGPTPERFWKVKPLQYTDVKLIEEILINLSTGVDPVLYQDTTNSIEAWKDAPFRPFLVARYRQSAFMFKAVTAYLDNLIAWGDSLFREYTGESINEAAQLYILAANILGPRPQAVPTKGSVSTQTYAKLRPHLDKFENALTPFETDIPFDLTPHPHDAATSTQSKALTSIGNALYFCIPRNDKLISYWDTVADRLFKIRNSLNIQGVFQLVPLFEPPIDPALLARAVAAGLDVGAIVSGLNQPLPLVRFQFLVQKALEICQEVKSLGNNLLAAMEKEDNEGLAILRAKHETVILGLGETIKYSTWQEAIKNREVLEQSITNATERYKFYVRLLGMGNEEVQIPTVDALDTSGLEDYRFKQSEPSVPTPDIQVGNVQDTSGEGGGKKLIQPEVNELSNLKDAHDSQLVASGDQKIGSVLGMIPTFGARFEPFGAGGTIGFGGSNLAAGMSLIAEYNKSAAETSTYQATNSAKIASYTRRELDWAFQRNNAAGEITQLFKQLRAAQIREAMAEHEWKNHQKQIEQAKEIEQFLSDELKGKATRQSFYTWMKREVKGLYGQCFQLAFDVAKKAERALQNEVGDPNLTYIQYGYLAGKQGLLAGEKLYLDVKRMEMAYSDLNQREYELTKHVSLLQLNPLALLQLRVTGGCSFVLPEHLLDFDCPGHYFRRIKSVALSVPCVVGPYAGVSCKLSLLKSSIRRNTNLGDNGYPRDGAEDDRFSDYFGTLQAIVTSAGQDDSGLFETNLHDERRLPFEWSGAVSEWRLELPSDVRQFDYNTIADVIIHLRYTAREGGDLLRNSAVASLESSIASAQAAGSVMLFSLRHEFPTEWAKFKSVQIGGTFTYAPLKLTLRPEHYPFWSQGRLEAILRVDLFAQTAKNSVQVTDKADGMGNKDSLVKDASMDGVRSGRLTNIPLPAPIGDWTLYYDDNSMDDLWLALTWGKIA